MEKKNPFVITMGFKKDDSDHVYVAELLNSMGRGKAQYIVKAVLSYQKMKQNGALFQNSGIVYDYDGIRKIVLQVLEEQKGKKEQESGPDNVSRESKQDMVLEKEYDLLQEFDENDLSGIMESLAAFQNQ